MKVIRSITLLALFIPFTLNAQTASSPPTVDHSAHSKELPVAVDGSKNPELIPDHLAYRHFIMAAAQHQNPSVEEFNQREALLDRLGFSKEDHDSFISALSNVRERLDAIDQARANLAANSVSSGSTRAALKLQQDQLLDNTRALIGKSLTSDGVTRLNDFIQNNVKKKIVIYGVQPQ